MKKLVRHIYAPVVLLSAMCALSACDSAIYDDEGDCTVTYRLTFRYDKNMKWADAFANEVESVNLYAFDESGILVWQQSEQGEALAADGYSMRLDLPAGDYKLIAWCGLKNDGATAESFAVPAASIGTTRRTDLKCTMARSHDGATAYSDAQLHSLFHGKLDVTLPNSDDGGTFDYTMSLTKDTNHVRVILQHLSGEAVDVDDFEFRIEEENGLMDCDNNLLPDELICYRPYHTGSATAGMGLDDYPVAGRAWSAPAASRDITSVSVAIADLSVARLVADRHTYLYITTKSGESVAKVPVADYALMLKDGYGREMTDQDYLDRQDEYALTFFLDERDKWIETSIIINSWKVVLSNVDFE